MTLQPSSDTNTPESPLKTEVMQLDIQTLMDLEILESEKQGASLFELCNHTRNKQGAQVLRERMERPWSCPKRIKAVQDSIVFILNNKTIFDQLPTFVITEIVEKYCHGIMPIVTSNNSIEFCAGAIEMRFGDEVRFYMIKRGVETTSNLIRVLRKIVRSPELNSVTGELQVFLDEVRAILAHSWFAQIPEEEPSDLSFWKVLRADQIFRMHEKHTVARLLELIYEIDALLALAKTTQKNSFIIPTIETGALRVKAEEVSHPFVENMICNSLELCQESRMLFLTGPNMAGKTTYLRSCATALYFAHLGMGVPAKAFSFVPADRLFSSINLTDNIHSGISFFHAEALRTKELAKAIANGEHVIAFMDEPFKGTNVKDAYDASSAILNRLATKEDCLFMFSSHLIELCDQMSSINQIDCRYFEAGEKGEKLTFEYKLHKGVSTQRLGMRVLEEEGIFDLLGTEQ